MGQAVVQPLTTAQTPSGDTTYIKVITEGYWDELGVVYGARICGAGCGAAP